TFLTTNLKKYAEPGAANIDAADRDRLIAIGQALQSTTWPAEVTGVVEAQGVSQVIGKMAYIPNPKGASGKGLGMMGNWLLGIPKGSQNGSAAADFIKWLIKSENMKTYVQNGGIPTRTSLLNDPALGQANPYFPALAQSLAAQPNWRPRTDQWNAVETIYGTLGNPLLYDAIKATAEYTALVLPVEILLGLGFALLVHRTVLRPGLRAAIYVLAILPLVVPPVAIGVVARLIYAPGYGVLDVILERLGLIHDEVNWLGDPTLAMLAVASVDVWQWTPFVYLVLFSGLQTVPRESVEAAQI